MLTNDNNIALRIEHLSISFRSNEGYQQVIDDVNLTVGWGRVLGVVGESGSGKTVSSLACMGLLPKHLVRIDSGKAIYRDGSDLLANDFEAAKALRGKKITMVFQEPMSSLNPSMRCGEQVAEAVRTHLNLNEKEVALKVIALFNEVELPDPETLVKRWPHELSGGQKQRVMIAMALASDPDLIIADEPTTALDVTVQDKVIRLLKRLQKERSLSMIFISHDLELVARIADDVAVMWKGKVVESGPAAEVLKNPSHPYTAGLLACKPPIKGERIVLPTVADALKDQTELAEVKKPFERTSGTAPILSVKALKKAFVTRRNLFGKPTAHFEAVKGVTFDLLAGETLGIVGESGCGKSTLSRMIMGLLPPDSGELIWHGIPQKQRSPVVQLVFQDPFSSLNPRITAIGCLTEALLVSGTFNDRPSAREGALKRMQEVGLPPEFANRYPHAFSGGQRQRLVIARALCTDPRVLILDESVAALDISVQAQVLNLLNRLKVERKLTYIFVSHDLRVVNFMSDRILVMYRGQIEEIGDAQTVMQQPKSAYTRSLMSAIEGLVV